MRYFVRCLACDRAFWLTATDAPCPVHTRWERQARGHLESARACEGSAREGYWIGEGEGPLRGWPGAADP